MAVDTAVDAELWLIFVAMIGWITLGCCRRSIPRQSTAAGSGFAAWRECKKAVEGYRARSLCLRCKRGGMRCPG